MNRQLPPGNFYGVTVQRHQVAGFSLSETRYTPGSTLPYHSHESHYFGFVLRGTYKENYGQSVRSCRPSMILYHPAGESHAQYFDSTAVHLFRIEMSQAHLRGLSHTDLDLECHSSRNGLAIGLAHKLYKEFCQPDAVSHLAIEGLTLELIAAIARQSDSHRRASRKPAAWLRRAHELIEAHSLEHLTLGDIARTVGVHPVTLAREFRRCYQCTIGDMVRRERIGFACRELLKSDVTLTNIALSAGFYDQSHFSKAFKRVIGITPARYRARLHRH